MDDTIDLGPCCCCGGLGQVRNLVMLPNRAPVPGTGWGCVTCGLPADGAIFVACDRCIDLGRPPREVCSGFVKARGRAPIATLDPEPFKHRAHVHAFDEAMRDEEG